MFPQTRLGVGTSKHHIKLGQQRINTGSSWISSDAESQYLAKKSSSSAHWYSNKWYWMRKLSSVPKPKSIWFDAKTQFRACQTLVSHLCYVRFPSIKNRFTYTRCTCPTLTTDNTENRIHSLFHAWLRSFHELSKIRAIILQCTTPIWKWNKHIYSLVS